MASTRSHLRQACRNLAQVLPKASLLRPSDQTTQATPLSQYPASPVTSYTTSPSLQGFHFANKLPPRQRPTSRCFIAANPGLCTQPQLLGHVGLMHSTSFTWQLEGSAAHEQRVRRNTEPEDWLADQRVRVVAGPYLPKLGSHFCWLCLTSPTSSANSWLQEGYVISPRSPASSCQQLSFATRVPRTRFA